MLFNEHLQVTSGVVIVDTWVVFTTKVFPVLLENGFESPANNWSEASL
jgi:hypothetical protein